MGRKGQRMKQIGRIVAAMTLMCAMLVTGTPIQTEAYYLGGASQAEKEVSGGRESAKSGQEAGEGQEEEKIYGEGQTVEDGQEAAKSQAKEAARREGQPVKGGQEAEESQAKEAARREGQTIEGGQETGEGQPEEPVQDGLVQEGKRYLLYVDGEQVTEEGWKELDGGRYYIGGGGYVTARMEEIAGNWRYYEIDVNTSGWAVKKDAWMHVLGTDYYFNGSGVCAKAYDVAKGQLSVLSGNGQMVLAANQAQALSDGRLYYFAAKGIRAGEQGWKKATSKEWYLVNAKGCVTAKMEGANGVWQYFDYQASGWKKAASVWKSVEGKEYFFGTSGKSAIIYTPDSGKCQKYSKGKMVSVKKSTVTLQDGRMYYFNGKGRQVAQAGWQKVSSDKYFWVGEKGFVEYRMSKSKGIWKRFRYDYSSGKWTPKGDVWEHVGGKDYCFGKSGKCSMIYDTAKKKCQKYSKGKMVSQKNTLCTLKNGRIYYFNAKGVRVDKAGWKKITARQYAKVGKKGYVTHKITNSSGGWKFYKQDYRTHKWRIQKKAWISVQEKKYYFNGKGNCTLIYHIKDKKCYDYKNGHMTAVRNDIRNIGGKKIYFGADGVRAGAAGLYVTSSGKLIYVSAKGYVKKEIRGIVMDYESSNGKISSCKVKDDGCLCYYNGQGILTRKLDLNGKMVALTYDDGPSEYTSAILDILEQNHSVATFFVLGQRVAGHASIIKRAYQMGCEIGNHTYSHQILTRVSAPVIRSQVSTTNTAVQGVTGAPCAVMRPPGGNYNGQVAAGVNMPLILWSIDTRDWKTRNAQSTQAAVLNHVKDGDIVLMHDLYGPTAEASRVIIPELVRQGYQLVTVSELADCRGGMINGMVYNAFR